MLLPWGKGTLGILDTEGEFSICRAGTIWDFFINATGLIGILCLAVPAWHANKYGRLVARLSALPTEDIDPEILDIRHETFKALDEIRVQWTAWKSRLLVYGTVLTGASYALGIIKSVVDVSMSR